MAIAYNPTLTIGDVTVDIVSIEVASNRAAGKYGAIATGSTPVAKLPFLDGHPFCVPREKHEGSGYGRLGMRSGRRLTREDALSALLACGGLLAVAVTFISAAQPAE